MTAPATGKTSMSCSDTNVDQPYIDLIMILRRNQVVGVPWVRGRGSRLVSLPFSGDIPAMLRRDSGDLSGEVDHEEQPASYSPSPFLLVWYGLCASHIYLVSGVCIYLLYRDACIGLARPECRARTRSSPLANSIHNTLVCL